MFPFCEYGVSTNDIDLFLDTNLPRLSSSGRESAVPPLECCLRGFAALCGPRFGAGKRGEVAQERLEALRVCFPSVIVAPSRTPACRY